MNIILKGLLAGNVNTHQMKLLMEKLLSHTRSRIINVAASIITMCPSYGYEPESEEQIVLHQNVVNDFSLLCMCVTQMTTLTADVLRELLGKAASPQLTLSLQILVRHVEDKVIKVAESIIFTIEEIDIQKAMEDFKQFPIHDHIISSIEEDEFQRAMESFKTVPIPDCCYTGMTNQELLNIWFQKS